MTQTHKGLKDNRLQALYQRRIFPLHQYSFLLPPILPRLTTVFFTRKNHDRAPFHTSATTGHAAFQQSLYFLPPLVVTHLFLFRLLSGTVNVPQHVDKVGHKLALENSLAIAMSANRDGFGVVRALH